MRSVRVWSLLAALAASAGGLFGTSYWQALSRVEGWDEVIPIIMTSPAAGGTNGMTAITATGMTLFFLPLGTGAIATNGVTGGVARNIFYLSVTGPSGTSTGKVSVALSGALGDAPIGAALTTDGAILYAIVSPTGPTGIAGSSGGSLEFIDTSTLLITGTQIAGSSFTGNCPSYVAVNPVTPGGLTPTGATAYLTSSDKLVYVVNTATRTITGGFNFAAGTQAVFPVITPTGSELYVTDLTTQNVLYSSLIGASYATGAMAGTSGASSIGGICMSPDGQYVYFVTCTGSGGTVGPYHYNVIQASVPSHTARQTIAVPTGISYAGCPIITPDGQTLLIPQETTTGSYPPGSIIGIIVLTGSTGPSSVSTTYSVYLTAGEEADCLAEYGFLPEKAPVALFTSSAHGSTIVFDASLALSLSGEIESYAWDFGDGTTTTTTFPITSHTYNEMGPFTTSLTVTNSFGDSSSVSYAGQMIYNNGGFLAATPEQDQ